MADFLPDPFEQAAKEVANKSWSDQVAHSSLFHSARSAVSSKGSFGSKGLGVAVGVGKLFLALIPVPIVGAVVGATVDAIQGKVRSGLHDRHLKPGATVEEKVKFSIKELTVENLDRYRWKVAHSYEALNAGITAYNKSALQGCDDMYAYALLLGQVERRKKKLRDELAKFKEVTDNVEAWIAELESKQDVEVRKITNAIKKKASDDLALFTRLVPTDPIDRASINGFTYLHKDCTNWCCFKKTAKYDPNTRWEVVKEWTGKVSNFLKPIAVSSIAVRGSDYTSNSDNSKFTA